MDPRLLSRRHWIGEWHDRCASQIADPIERLRYLRRAGGVASAANCGAGGSGPRRWRWLIGSLVIVGFFLMPHRDLPVQARTSAGAFAPSSAPSSMDRRLPLPSPSGFETPVPSVWLVEHKEKEGVEVYSNGLRIEAADSVKNEPRVDGAKEVAGRRIVTGAKEPAGIIYHTTESSVPPFEESQNYLLRYVAEGIKGYVLRRRSYHYLIDRFGRVHRIVREQDAAWHAGASIWADAKQVYVGLNHSFLAVAFESETLRGDKRPRAVTPAQIHSARILTEALRSKYRIPSFNCVSHAQVSVNPVNFRIGDHTDWAANFPFVEVGLPDNYARPLPSVYEFGFIYDNDFLAATGPRLWRGLAASDDYLREEAIARGVDISSHRAELKKRYIDTLAALGTAQRAEGASKEKNP